MVPNSSDLTGQKQEIFTYLGVIVYVGLGHVEELGVLEATDGKECGLWSWTEGFKS